MPFVPVPGAAFCAVGLELDGQNIQVCLDVAVPTETIGALEDAAAGLFGLWAEHLMPNLSGDLTLLSAVCAGLASESSPIGVFVPSSPVLGSVTAASLPNNVAYCISKYTGLRGRSFRGRMFIPGIPENARTTASHVDPAFRVSIATGCASLLGGMISGGFPPVVVSRFTAGAARATGIATPITQLAPVDDVLDSQRRRLPGRGS